MSRSQSSFFAWLLPRLHAPTGIGELARAALQDPAFPRLASTKPALLAYYHQTSASADTLQRFEAAWTLYAPPPRQGRTETS